LTVNLNEIYRDPLLYQWYNPSFSYSENIIVINGKSILTYIPDEFQRVQINGKVETNKIPQNTNEFKVNYHLGIIEFHPTIQDGSNFTVTYYARGIIKHPAVRTYIQDKLNLINSDNVEDALQEIFSRINNIVASTGNSNTEIVDARYDGVNNITHPTLKSRLDKTDERVGVLNNLNTTQKNNLVSAINELNNNFQKQSQQSTTIGHGLNVINSSQNSPLDVKIEGRTLVNVSQNVLDPAKYYVLSDKKSKVKFSDGTTYSGVAKFAGRAEKPILIRMENFEGKVAGSTVENPHIIKTKNKSTLEVPTGFSYEPPTSGANSYASFSKLDSTLFGTGYSSLNGEMAQTLFSFNLIEAIERNVGKIPASDTAGKVAWLKNNIAKLTCNWWGYGQSPSGYKAYLKRWDGTQWISASEHTNPTITKISAIPNVSTSIQSDGMFHALAHADPSDGATASTINTDYVELEIELAQNAQLWNPRFPLYEVDATEYANILTTWDENEVMRRYPMVESVQHVQNPYILAEGENLLGNNISDFTTGLSFNGEYFSKTNNTGYDGYQEVAVIGGQVYTFSVVGYTDKSDNNEAKVSLEFRNRDNNVINETALRFRTDVTPTKKSTTVTAPTNATKVRVYTVAQSKTIYFKELMLCVGDNINKPFVPRNPSYLFAEVKLGALSDKKDILWKYGQDWKVLKWVEKDYVLDGKLSWLYTSDYLGSKRVRIPNFLSANQTVTNLQIFTKFNGIKLKTDSALVDSGFENAFIYGSTGELNIIIPDTDSGWSEHYKPSNQEVQAYFNGWKANGYTTGTAVTNELTGQLASSGTYTFANAGAYRNIVVEKSTDGSTWSPATEGIDFKIDISGTKAVLTNFSLSPLYFRISYNYGVSVNSWASLVDGSAPATNTLAYVSANMAPGFTPYKLSYVLATPKTEVVTDKVEGDLVINGQTQVEVGSGVIIREKIVPVTSSESGYYHINNESIGTIPQNRLKNRLLALIGIYRNGIKDNKWITRTNYCYGNQRFEIAKADYDPTAEYTVTYLLLDRQQFTTNILSVIATYDSSLKSVVDSIVAKQSDIMANQSALVRSVAELYKRIKALGG